MRARLHGEELEGRARPVHHPLPKCSSPPCCLQGGRPACLREGSIAHTGPASPADAWDPRRKSVRKHLPAPAAQHPAEATANAHVRAPRSSTLLPEPGFAMTVLGNTRARRTALRDTSRRKERVPRPGAAACPHARAGAQGIPRESLLLYRGKFGPSASLEGLSQARGGD